MEIGENVYRRHSNQVENNQPDNINVSDSFDKEEFYAYIKKKPKGVEAISDELESERLAYIKKHSWNITMRWINQDE